MFVFISHFFLLSGRSHFLQAFLKKWWVESDIKTPNLPLSLRLKGSGYHYISIYNNTGTKLVK
jgi:hypothetical protein